MSRQVEEVSALTTESLSEASDAERGLKVFRIDEAAVQDHLGKLVRSSVEETLNALLDAEADELCGAARYERIRLAFSHAYRAACQKLNVIEGHLSFTRKRPIC